MSNFNDIGVEKIGHVGLIEIRKPPLNFFDISLINQIADALEEFDRDIEIRASVLAAQGKAFCSGANFNDPARQEQEARAKADPASNLGPIAHLYVQAVRIFRNKKPIVAAVHGAAIGGGLGLAVSADFRVTCPEARFAANFTKLGFHPGFGLTATLPDLVGKNNAELIFYTSRRVTGEEAYRMGLANVCVPQDQVRAEAMKLAAEIAECSPLGLISTRATMRGNLADRVLAATNHELVGKNNAELIFYTSRRVTGEEACKMGLANECVPQDQVRNAAMKLAQEIAECSPLGLLSTRATMRAGLADRVMAATTHELGEQTRLRATEDFKEGVKATEQRRVPNFKGR